MNSGSLDINRVKNIAPRSMNVTFIREELHCFYSETKKQIFFRILNQLCEIKVDRSTDVGSFVRFD